jgi:hypothetical protein
MAAAVRLYRAIEVLQPSPDGGVPATIADVARLRIGANHGQSDVSAVCQGGRWRIDDASEDGCQNGCRPRGASVDTRWHLGGVLVDAEFPTGLLAHFAMTAEGNWRPRSILVSCASDAFDASTWHVTLEGSSSRGAIHPRRGAPHDARYRFRDDYVVGTPPQFGWSAVLAQDAARMWRFEKTVLRAPAAPPGLLHCDDDTEFSATVASGLHQLFLDGDTDTAVAALDLLKLLRETPREPAAWRDDFTAGDLKQYA